MGKKGYTDKELKAMVKKLFPKKEISLFTKKDPSLYASVRNHATKEGLSVNALLNNWGFTVINTRKIKANGKVNKCNRCSNLLPDDPTYTSKSCPDCRKARSEMDKKLRKKRELNGLCKKCGVELPENSKFLWCDDCRELSRESTMKLTNYRLDHKLCVSCGKPLDDPNSNWRCTSCKVLIPEEEKITDYVPANKVYTDEKIVELVLEIYTDKVVNHLARDHWDLYHNVWQTAKFQGMKVDEYLEMLGFDYGTKQNK